MTYIRFNGYANIEGEMSQLDPDKLTFPIDAVSKEPFEFLKKFFRSMGIEYYLFTYDKIEVEE